MVTSYVLGSSERRDASSLPRGTPSAGLGEPLRHSAKAGAKLGAPDPRSTQRKPMWLVVVSIAWGSAWDGGFESSFRAKKRAALEVWPEFNRKSALDRGEDPRLRGAPMTDRFGSIWPIHHAVGGTSCLRIPVSAASSLPSVSRRAAWRPCFSRRAEGCTWSSSDRSLRSAPLIDADRLACHARHNERRRNVDAKTTTRLWTRARPANGTNLSVDC
jgi:hypothetical protein